MRGLLALIDIYFSLGFLAAITAMPEVRALDPARCQGYLEQLRGRYPIYANIGLLDLRGDIVCHAAGGLSRFNAADRDYFREAIAQRRFVMGQMTQGRAVRRAVLPFALPVIEAGMPATAGKPVGRPAAE